MKKNRNLAKISKNISSKILDSIYLIDILNDLADGEAKKSTILNIVRNNLKTSFNDIEHCRKIISVQD